MQGGALRSTFHFAWVNCQFFFQKMPGFCVSLEPASIILGVVGY